MADKDSIGGLNEAVETLNKDNHQDSIQSNQVLGTFLLLCKMCIVSTRRCLKS